MKHLNLLVQQNPERKLATMPAQGFVSITDTIVILFGSKILNACNCHKYALLNPHQLILSVLFFDKT